MKISCFLQEKKGFTLLELTAVVIILGILARVALPRFSRVAEKNRSAEGRMLLIATRAAQLRYHADHGFYTNDISQLDITYTTPKYFYAPQPQNAGGTPNYIVIINHLVSGGSQGPGYTLMIDESGNITCSNVVGYPTCADIGM